MIQCRKDWRSVIAVFAVGILLTASGCNDVPTFQELTGEATDGEVPDQQVAGADDKNPPPGPGPSPPAAKTPQEIIDGFLATEPRMRSNALLKQVAGLDTDLLRQITVLDLSDSQVNDPGAPLIEKFPAVEELNLSGTAVTNEGMQQVAKAKGLRKVSLDRMIIDGEGLQALADHEQMLELSISQTPISDEAFKHLQKMDELEVLRVSGSRTLQGHGFDELVKNRVMNNLRELHAAGTGFGYYGLRNLKSMPALEVLILRDAEVSDNTMPGIVSCRNLRELDISRNPIGNGGLKLLAQLDKLESLKIAHCVGVTDEGLQYLRGLKTLKILDLTGCRCRMSQVRELKEEHLKTTEIHFNNEVL